MACGSQDAAAESAPRCAHTDSPLTGCALAGVEKELLFLVKKYLVIDREICGTYAHHVFL